MKFLYTLKDGKTGNLLWQREQAGSYSTSADSGNLLANLIANAITSMIENGKADYTPVANQANAAALLVGGTGLPYGPYSPQKKFNNKEFPATGTGKLSDAKTKAASYPVDLLEGGKDPSAQ